LSFRIVADDDNLTLLVLAVVVDSGGDFYLKKMTRARDFQLSISKLYSSIANR